MVATVAAPETIANAARAYAVVRLADTRFINCQRSLLSSLIGHYFRPELSVSLIP